MSFSETRPGVPKQREIISQYEKEKIEHTTKELDLLRGTMQNYLAMIQFCEEKDIEVHGRKSLDYIRDPNQPAGPDSDIQKLLLMFQRGQTELIRNIDVKYQKELEQRMQK